MEKVAWNVQLIDAMEPLEGSVTRGEKINKNSVHFGHEQKYVTFLRFLINSKLSRFNLKVDPVLIVIPN